MLGRPVLGPANHLLGMTDPLTMNGDVKRKRGRPRTLDGPQDDNACFGPRITSVQVDQLDSPGDRVVHTYYNRVILVSANIKNLAL